MFLDVEALSVDIIFICLGVLLAIERYPCGDFLSSILACVSDLNLPQSVYMLFGIYKLFLCELCVSTTLLNCLTD